MNLSITKVEAVTLNIPRRDGRAPGENLLVRIHTSEGIMGIGSVYLVPVFGETAASALVMVKNHYTSLLLQQNPLNIESLLARLDNFIPGHMPSKAAIDIALHDIKGKVLDAPVYQLLGGLARDKVQLLAPQIQRAQCIDVQPRIADAEPLIEGVPDRAVVGGAEVSSPRNRQASGGIHPCDRPRAGSRS